jgi:hypothetical protein
VSHTKTFSSLSSPMDRKTQDQGDKLAVGTVMSKNAIVLSVSKLNETKNLTEVILFTALHV